MSTYTRREEIPERFKWDLTRIYNDDAAWRADCARLSEGVDTYAALRGTLRNGPGQLLAAYRLDDELGQLAYRIWYYVSLRHDEDQRDNEVGGRRQEVMLLFMRWRQAASWFAPELLTLPLETVRAWMAEEPGLDLYRFVIEEVYRQQEHVLDAKGEHLLSLSGKLSGAPTDAYAALSTADVVFPTIELASGPVTLTPGKYRALLTENRNQAQRTAAADAYNALFQRSGNTYAALYEGVLQRDWFHAQARGYPTTLDAALFGNAIPTSVVESLIAATREGLAPFHRLHALRKRVLGLEKYYPSDTAVSLVDLDRQWPYDEVLPAIEASVAPLGAAYRDGLREALHGRYVDVYESPGKASGAYSAPVYGVHPYMLMNYNDTLDAAFTLAHELGHTMHTRIAHRAQPFVYAGYTIFVAEVPSTLSESLFLEHMLRTAGTAKERAALLEHAINEIAGTFYGQVMFADFELRAHRLVEQGQPITADVLGELYAGLVREWYGDTLELRPVTPASWARVTHFFQSPYYVYQYATCYASSAQIVREILEGSEADRADAVTRYLALLAAGGSDHPMELLRRAGVDLARPEPVQAVVAQLDRLVTRLERELAAL